MVDEVLAKYDNVSLAQEYLDDLIELKMLTNTKETAVLWPSDSNRYNGTPTAYRIAITEHCNLACTECFVTKNKVALETMSQDTLFAVLDDAVAHANGQTLTFHFFGGEPLIRFELIKKAVARLDHLVTIGKIHQPIYTITTNATMVTDDVISFFLEHNFVVGVSVDGTRDLHNALRPYVNGYGSYDDVIKNYQRMVNAGIDTHVLVTPNPSHLDDLVGVVREILCIFPMKTITINTPFRYDTLRWSVPGAKYAEILFEIMRIAKSKDISVDSAATPAIAAITNGMTRTSACSITGENFMASVSPSGTLSYCAQKWHESLALSNRPFVNTLAKCSECEALKFCGGVCPAFIELSGANCDKNKCDFMHALLPHLVENLDLFEEKEDANDTKT